MTSTESLDLQRQLLLRNSCGRRKQPGLRLEPGFDADLKDAVKTPFDSERTSKVGHTTKMESLATTIHREYWFISMFLVVTVYGL